MAVVSVDAAQCYDRVNHVIMALAWYALIGKIRPILVLITVLHEKHETLSAHRFWHFNNLPQRRTTLKISDGIGTRQQGGGHLPGYN